jgi:16S rRNA (uracil1498-N3)-methyltransferase
MSIRLYYPDLRPGAITLSPEESHHAVKVMRCTVGAAVQLFDGQGHEAPATVTLSSPKRTEVEARTVVALPFDIGLRVALVVAMPRTHRQSVLIEKCTELGASSIRPLLTQRTIAQPGPGAGAKWRRRAIEAAKQSGRAWVPSIERPIAFRQAIASAGEYDAAVLLDVDARLTFAELLQRQATGGSMMILIGPEGGWTADELQNAVSSGVTTGTLGPTILRSETAAIAACANVAGWTQSLPQ